MQCPLPRERKTKRASKQVLHTHICFSLFSPWQCITVRRQHPGPNLVVNIEPDPTERGLQQRGLLLQEGRSLFHSFMEAPRLAPHEHPHIFQSLPVFHKADAWFPSQFFLRESLYLPPSARRAYAGSKLCNLAMMILALCLHQKNSPPLQLVSF